MKTKLQFGSLILSLALTALVHAQSVPTDGLVAYYPFNGNANDASGNGHNGAVVGATLTTNRFGDANRAYSFNGTAYIQCPDTGLPSGNNPRTVCLWMNIASYMGTITYPFGYGTTTPSSAFYATANSLYYPKPTIGLGMVNNVDTPRWGEAITNVWYFVAITYGNSTATLFINGDNVGEAPRTFGTILNGSFFIGGNNDASIASVTFSGKISDVRIYNRALSTSEVQQLYQYESQPHPAQGTQVYYTDIVDHSGTAAVIRRVNSDGTGLVPLLTGLQHPRAIALDVSGGKVYWGELGIRRANLDGTGPIESIVPTGDSAPGLALDLMARKLYWTAGSNDPGLRRANLDGSGQQNLITSGIINPTGLALDTVHGKMYWTDLEGNRNGTGSIHRSNLDGSQAETLLTEVDEAYGIAVDAVGGKIYWPELSTHKIQRANLDGSGVEDLVTGLDTPVTISLDLSEGKMYWTDSDWSGQVNRISRANLNGSNVQIIVSGVGFPFGIAVAPGVGPKVDLIKAVKPSFANLRVGTKYQLQSSADMKTWTNQGSPFTATNTSMVYPQYWDVDNWNSLFFRLQVGP